MIGIICSGFLAVVGVLIAFAGGYVSFSLVPGIIEDQILQNVILTSDTIQLERFLEPPVSLDFKVYLFNITNPEDVIERGSAPVVKEIGPYYYTSNQQRDPVNMEDNYISYVQLTNYIFNAEASYPLTEDDVLTVVNVPYLAILQKAEVDSPNLLAVLNPLLNQVFGAANNRPIIEVSVKDYLFDGIRMCENPSIFGQIACNPIRESAELSDNMRIYEDGSFSFSFFYHKSTEPSKTFVIDRGFMDEQDLGRVVTFDNFTTLSVWPNDDDGGLSYCNMINGTDGAIYHPFINRTESLYAYNSDICRSVELRYQSDYEYEGIPVVAYSSGPWIFDDFDCFCANETEGVTRENGCLYPGVMELYPCSGAHLVFSAPHFLYADEIYRNGVIGLTPDEEKHRIILQLEPRSGTIVRGAKRAQFNIFLRPISSITGTSALRTVLTPILWIEDSFALPEDLVEEVTNSLLRPIQLVEIFRTVVIAVGCSLSVIGLFLVIRLYNSVNKTLPLNNYIAEKNNMVEI